MFFSSRLVTLLLFLVSTPWFSGCATTRTYGTNAAVNEDALSLIHAGTSTSDDLRHLLGEPTEVNSLGPNLELWTYRYIEYRGAHVPLLGEVSTGNEQESEVKFHLRDNRVERLERSRTQRNNSLY